MLFIVLNRHSNPHMPHFASYTLNLLLSSWNLFGFYSGVHLCMDYELNMYFIVHLSKKNGQYLYFRGCYRGYLMKMHLKLLPIQSQDKVFPSWEKEWRWWTNTNTLVFTWETDRTEDCRQLVL